MSVASSKHRNRHGRVGMKAPKRKLSLSDHRRRALRADRVRPEPRPAVPKSLKKLEKQGVIVDEIQRFGDMPITEESVVEHSKKIIEDAVMLDTKGAAAHIGMSVGYVKDHAQALGGEKHGLRWRFDQATLGARWEEMSRG